MIICLQCCIVWFLHRKSLRRKILYSLWLNVFYVYLPYIARVLIDWSESIEIYKLYPIWITSNTINVYNVHNICITSNTRQISLTFFLSQSKYKNNYFFYLFSKPINQSLFLFEQVYTGKYNASTVKYTLSLYCFVYIRLEGPYAEDK